MNEKQVDVVLMWRFLNAPSRRSASNPGKACLEASAFCMRTFAPKALLGKKISRNVFGELLPSGDKVACPKACPFIQAAVFSCFKSYSMLVVAESQPGILPALDIQALYIWVRTAVVRIAKD